MIEKKTSSRRDPVLAHWANNVCVKKIVGKKCSKKNVGKKIGKIMSKKIG